MKETGPEAVPPLASGSIEPRMFERLMPEPEPPRKIMPSLVFQSRIDSIVSSTERMKQARALRALLEADVEPDRRVERRHLVQQDVGELGLEGVARPRRWRSSRAARPQPAIVPATRPIICLTERSRVGRAELAAEVLLGDDVGRVLRPARGELDVALLEGDAVAVADARVAQLPLDGVERVRVGRGEEALDSERRAGGGVLVRSWGAGLNPSASSPLRRHCCDAHSTLFTWAENRRAHVGQTA